MSILERIAEMEKRLRSAGFNAPIEYGSLKGVCFSAADLLAEIYTACHFENYELERLRHENRHFATVIVAHCDQQTIEQVLGANWQNYITRKNA